MDTLLQKLHFLIMKINNFPGRLIDISAKKEALRVTARYQHASSQTLPENDVVFVCMSDPKKQVITISLSDIFLNSVETAAIANTISAIFV